MIGFRRIVQLRSCLSKIQYNFCQTVMTSLLVPPSSVRGQTSIDYGAFNIVLQNVPSIYLNSQLINKFRGKLQKYLLKFPNFKPIQSCEELQEDQSIIYLDPRTVKDVSDELKEEIGWDIVYKEKDLELTYKNWPCDEILRAILPENVEVPTSYSQIGHIIHLNLHDDQLPYKNVIGQVFLDKILRAKTVVNKLDGIDNTYRNFAMEFLAGEQNTIVSVKESGCTYQFDFAKVYWNPRLSTEHATLVNFLKEGDILYDVFAGVGPFAIPATRKGVRVLANDLNPESYKWLLISAKINKKRGELIAFNKDGRDFLKNDVKKDILDRRSRNASGSEHMAMNLPALAVDFLDVFSNWLNTEEIEKVCSKPPTVHVYCFIKAGKTEDLKALSKKLVEEKLGTIIPTDALKEIHHVRNVAPNKEMMRISFLLTKEILRSEEPAKKKMKLTNCNMDNNFPGNNGQEQI